MADTPPRWLLAAVAVAGVVVPGVAHYWLASAGYGVAADVAWLGGYGLAVFAVWYGWLRHVEFTGPSG